MGEKQWKENGRRQMIFVSDSIENAASYGPRITRRRGIITWPAGLEQSANCRLVAMADSGNRGRSRRIVCGLM
ncbi:MAG: hypothetical protein RLZZ436_1391 [Planctomycetota bacterium]|jgi:hypothetical protein